MQVYKEYIDYIIHLFNVYYGDRRYFILFLTSIILNLALLKKEEKIQKNLVVYLPLILIVLIINPFVFAVVRPFTSKGQVYWRFFWLFPIAPTVAYAFTKIVKEKKEKFSKVFLVLFITFVISFSGIKMFSEANYQKVNNVYKVRDDILSAIVIIGEQEKENKKAMVPIEIVPWVRQYDASISIEYDRSPSNSYSWFVRAFEECKIKAYMQKYLDDGCNFIVLNRWGEYDANPEDYGFEKVGENVNFLVYMLK